MSDSVFQNFSRTARRHTFALSLAGATTACHAADTVKPAAPPSAAAMNPDAEYTLDQGDLNVKDRKSGASETYYFDMRSVFRAEKDGHGQFVDFDAVDPARIRALWKKRRELNGGQDYRLEYGVKGNRLNIYDQKTRKSQAYDFGTNLFFPGGSDDNTGEYTQRFDALPPARVAEMRGKFVTLNGGRGPDLTKTFDTYDDACTPDPAWPARPLTAGEKALNAKWYADELDLNRAFIQFCTNEPADRAADAPSDNDGFRVYGRKHFSKDYSTDTAAESVQEMSVDVHEWMHKVQFLQEIEDNTPAAAACKIYEFTLTPATKFDDLCVEQQAAAMGAAFLLSKGIQHGFYLSWFKNWDIDAPEEEKNATRALLRSVVSQRFPHLAHIDLGEKTDAYSADTMIWEHMVDGKKTSNYPGYTGKDVAAWAQGPAPSETPSNRLCHTSAFTLKPETKFRDLCVEQQATALQVAFLLAKGEADLPYVERYKNWDDKASDDKKDEARVLLRRVVSEGYPHLAHARLGETLYARAGSVLTVDILNGEAQTLVQVDFSKENILAVQRDSHGKTSRMEGKFNELMPEELKPLEDKFIRLGGVLPSRKAAAPLKTKIQP